MSSDVPRGAERLRPAVDSVALRLYRQGLGDCFLLAFPRTAGDPFYLLIDCGVIHGTPEPSRVMEGLVRDIAAATGNRIDLLIITHEHWDHVSGFVQAEKLWRSLNIHIETIWMSWTEDMSIPLALQLKQDFQNDLDALRLALDRTGRDTRRSAALAGLLGLFGDPFQVIAAAKEKRRFSEVTHEALRTASDLAGNRVQYRKPGESLTLPDVAGVRIHVLGPPQSERALRRINPSRRKPETYTHSADDSQSSPRSRGSSKSSTKSAFTLALKLDAPSEMMTQPLSDADKDAAQRSFPFEPRFRVPLQDAAKTDFFLRHYGVAQGEQVPPPAPTAAAGPAHALSTPPVGPEWRRVTREEAEGFGIARSRKTSQRRKRATSRSKRKIASKMEKRRREAEIAQQPGSEASTQQPESAYPFDRHLRIDLEIAAQMPFFYEHYGFDGPPPPIAPPPQDVPARDLGTNAPDWRRIDTDWLDIAGDVALQMDSYTNNTSLALAIELTGTGKVLLFPADAQVGNWLSWDMIEPALVGSDGKPLTASDLLRRTVFYKVGHHGSHNATMRAQGLERMTSPELIAFLPVDEHVAHEVRNWRAMPFEPMLARLYEMTSGRVIRLDHGVVTDGRPEFVPEDVWTRIAPTAKAFRDARVQSGGRHPGSADRPLYFQLTIVDAAVAPDTAGR
jgi:hypothetical protein